MNIHEIIAARIAAKKEEGRMFLNKCRIIIGFFFPYFVGFVVTLLGFLVNLRRERKTKRVRRIWPLSSSTLGTLHICTSRKPVQLPAALKNRINDYMRGRIKSYVCFIPHSGLLSSER